MMRIHRLFSSVSAVTMRSYPIDFQPFQARKMAKILDGKSLSKQLNSELREEINEWIRLGHRKPRLICILVGDDPASATYVKNKMIAAESVGMESSTLRLDSNITEYELINKIDNLNRDSQVDGILVQLPLPNGIEERAVCNAVSPRKDVDGFHIENVGRFCLDMEAFLPATPLGVVEIIKRFKIDTFGQNAVVVGRSKNVGMPIAMLLHSDGAHESHSGLDATVTICHRYTPKEQLKVHCLNADIIISAAGVPGLITADMVKPGAAIIDVGITRITNEQTGKTKLVGDVAFEEVSKVAGYITPVPGGVGPMTVAMLMRNTFKAAQMHKQLNGSS